MSRCFNPGFFDLHGSTPFMGVPTLTIACLSFYTGIATSKFVLNNNKVLDRFKVGTSHVQWEKGNCKQSWLSCIRSWYSCEGHIQNRVIWNIVVSSAIYQAQEPRWDIDSGSAKNDPFQPYHHGIFYIGIVDASIQWGGALQKIIWKTLCWMFKIV